MAVTSFEATVFCVILMLIGQTYSAPQNALNTISSTVKAPANLSYEELVYIMQTRNGAATSSPRVLTPCARAILGCCKDKQMNESCSESLSCGAFFFDDNPCEDKFVLDALNAAKSFYQQKNVSNA